MHTPGPWIVEPHSDEDETLYVCANYSETSEGFARATWIAECDLQDGNLEENSANASLIAAAPELLDALKMMLAAYESVLPGIRYIAVQNYKLVNDAPVAAERAIARAEGR